jgi:hypothetical protein
MLDGALGSLLRRQRKRRLEELEERGLARIGGTDDENTGRV